MENLETIPIERIKTETNVRTNVGDVSELMNSIKHSGLLQPIGVCKTQNGFVLRFGNRRLEACKKLGWKNIDAIVADNIKDKEKLIQNIIENVQREDITPLELGIQIEELKETHNMSLKETAELLSKPLGTISNAWQLYRALPKERLKDVRYASNNKSGIHATTAYRVLRAAKTAKMDKAETNSLFDTVKKEGYSVRDVALLGKLMQKGMNIETAKKSMKKYSWRRGFDIIYQKEEMDTIKKVFKSSNVSEILTRMLRGEIKTKTFFATHD